jgi:hypothetical protein
MIEKTYAVAKIEGVVIAEAGQGLEISDIEEMIRYFTLNRLPKVALKLPQAQAMKVFGQEDGAPALGWVSRIYREGKKLLADFRKVPKIVARALREGPPRLRVEVAHNLRDEEGRKWQAALRAVVVNNVPFPTISTLGEMSVAFMSEGASRRSEEPSIDELTRCRVALTGEEYGVAVRGVLRANPEAARQYLRVGQGPR